jgi:hypothetical protein
MFNGSQLPRLPLQQAQTILKCAILVIAILLLGVCSILTQAAPNLHCQITNKD